jgi:hypothetical protein
MVVSCFFVYFFVVLLGMKLVLLVLPVFGGLRHANPPYVV